MARSTSHGRMGVLYEAEQLLQPASTTTEADPTLHAQGVQPTDRCGSLRWMVKMPDDIASYDVQLWRYSDALEAWVKDGDPFLGNTANQTFEQRAGGPLFLQLTFVGTSATGFSKAAQGFNAGV